MRKKYLIKNFLVENISQVRDGFSAYLNASQNQPIIVTERGKPKSVIIDYDYYLKLVSEQNHIIPNQFKEKRSRNYTKASDFRGIANPKKLKIDINKEIEDAWLNGY